MRLGEFLPFCFKKACKCNEYLTRLEVPAFPPETNDEKRSNGIGRLTQLILFGDRCEKVLEQVSEIFVI